MDNKTPITSSKSLFDRFFNLDEFKSLSLVFALYISLGFGIFFTFELKDIPPNLEVVILALIGAVGGVAAFNMIANRNSNNQYGSQYYDPNSNYSNQYSQYGNNQYQPYQNQQMSQNGMSGANDSMMNQTNPSMSDPPVGQIPIVNNQNTGTNNPV